MRRQLIVNGAILGLSLGTLGIVWFTRDAPSTGQLEARNAKLLPTFDKEAVSGLVLRKGQQRIELIGSGDEFRIVFPWQERADIASVSSLLGSLDLASPLRPADGASRDLAGLLAPLLELSVQTRRGRQKLVLGGPAPTPSGAHYAEVTVEGSPPRLFTVSQGLVAELDLPFSRFRETRLLRHGPSELSWLEIQVDEPAALFRITQDTNGERWFEHEGRKELADRDAVDAIFTALSRLSTERFLEPAAALAALGSNVVHIRLQPRDTASPSIELSLGGACPEAPEQSVVIREEQGGSAKAGCIARDIGEPLRVAMPRMALNTPCFARADEVEELSLRIGASKLELARKESGFLLRAPSTANVPLDAGNQRVADIVHALATRVADPALSSLGLEPPAGELSVQTTGVKDRARSLERVLIGKQRPDGSLCVQRERDKVVLCLDPEAARSFRPDATLLKGLDVLSFAASDLARLSIEREGRTERVLRSGDGIYRFEEPAGVSHDGSLVADAVQALGSLRAERWVADADDGSFGLGQPRLRVTLELTPTKEGVARQKELSIGATTRGGVFATLGGDLGVFVLPRSLLAELDTSLVDRSLSPFASADLAELELLAGRRSLRLRRRGAVWQADGSLSQARIDELTELLSSLRAEFNVHVGPPIAREGLANPSLSVTFTHRDGTTRKLRIGGGDTIKNTKVFFARLEGVDATFAIAESALVGLQDF